MILFDNFKQFLQLVVSNSQTVGQNAVLSDADYAQSLSDHITALTPDQNLRLNTTNVELASGLLVSDPNSREIRFEPKGSGRIVQGFLEANISAVQKLWQRSDDSLGTATAVPYGTLADGRRYYAVDLLSGVYYLNEYGQISGAVPGFGDLVTGYGSPVSCLTFTVAGTEYIAILAAEHFLRIYQTSDFALVATFGTPGTTGTPDAALMDTPTDLAFDEATSTLYVSCSGLTGPSVPAGASGPGIVFSLDLTALPVIAFGSYIAQDGSSLHQGQVSLPAGLFFDSTDNALWVLTGDATNTSRPYEIGGLSVTGTVSDGYLKGYLEFQGSGFSLSSASRIHIDVDRRRLYVTNSPGIEVFDLVTLKHLYTFGYYGSDAVSSSTPEPPVVAPISGKATAVASDILTVDGVQVNMALFSDGTNNRIVRVGENLYEGENVVTFVAETLTVPLSLHGYLVKGTLSSAKVRIEYRTSATGVWQVLSQTDSVPASSFFQFRMKAVADLTDLLQNRSISEVIVIGEQE